MTETLSHESRRTLTLTLRRLTYVNDPPPRAQRPGPCALPAPGPPCPAAGYRGGAGARVTVPPGEFTSLEKCRSVRHRDRPPTEPAPPPRAAPARDRRTRRTPAGDGPRRRYALVSLSDSVSVVTSIIPLPGGKPGVRDPTP